MRKAIENEAPMVWQSPEAAEPVKLKEIKKPWHKREITIDPKTGEQRMEIVDDFGASQILGHGLQTYSVGRENYAIMPDDPLSARMETHWTEEMKRGRWQVRTETYGRLTATKTHWIVWGKIDAFEGKKRVFTKEVSEPIERKLQ